MKNNSLIRVALLVLIGGILLARIIRPAPAPVVEPAPDIDGQVEELVVQPDGTVVHRASTLQEILAVPDRTVILDFWANWCGPCRMLAPELEKVAQQMGNQVVVAKVNVTTEQELSSHFQVNAIPDIRFFRNNAAVGGTGGYQSAQSIIDQLPK